MVVFLLSIISLIRKSIKRHPFLLGGGLIFLICLLAYGQITGMYFFLDDYLLLYSLQHPNVQMGGYGLGVFGSNFGYSVTLFIPFYHLFGLNPFGYYFAEVVLYFLAALTVYFFAKTLTDSRKVALGSALIFASGYVGSESLYRLAIGWQNLLAAIFITLTAALYYKYTKTPRIKYYLLAFAVYLFTLEFSFYRAEGIILLILGTEVFFNFKPLLSISRMIPFSLSYWYFYVYSISNVIDQGSKSAVFIQKIFTEGNFHLLLTPLKTLENIFIPDKFGIPLLIFTLLLIGILIWRKSRILIFCLIFTIANYIVYFYSSPESVQETTHRYLTISFVGVALFWGIFLSGVFKSTKKYLFFCLLIIILNLTLVRADQVNILQNRSEPSREFWQSFQREVSHLPSQSAIYIDSKQDGVSKPARDRAIGAGSISPAASWAVYYGLLWEDIFLAENFSDLLSLIKTGKVNRDNIYTFFYSRQGGLVDTTKGTKEALFGDGDYIAVDAPLDINLPFHSPVILKFSSEANLDFSTIRYLTESRVDLSKYLSYLASRERYWEKVKASATTETKYAEAAKMVDRSGDTGWKGDNLTWAKVSKEEIILNLGQVRNIGAIRITLSSLLGRVLTKYSYECSLDGKNWKKLGSFQKKIEKTEPFTDRFNPSSCAFVKLIVYDTVSHAAPQITELEVLEDQFSDLDIDLAEKIDTDPFLYISSPSDKQLLSEYFAQNGMNGKICVHSDKYPPLQPACKRYKFKLGVGNGEFFIDQGGTVLQKIEFLLPAQVELKVQSVTVVPQSFAQLEPD